MMGELIDDLERLGYVRRTPHPKDRRSKLVTKGYRCIDAGLRTIETIERRLRKELGVEASPNYRPLRNASSNRGRP